MPNLIILITLLNPQNPTFEPVTKCHHTDLISSVNINVNIFRSWDEI